MYIIWNASFEADNAGKEGGGGWGGNGILT